MATKNRKRKNTRSARTVKRSRPTRARKGSRTTRTPRRSRPARTRKGSRPTRAPKRFRPARTRKRSRPIKSARKVRRSKPAATVKATTPTQQRLWLMYPPGLIQEPLVWQLGHRFNVTTNIRQASVTDEIGIVCLEVDGKRDAVKASIKWLEKMGVNVEPVEINVIES